ncbi:MAG: PEP-CTERM sorting domain-containing protein [Vitreoscilla sp.]
MALTAHAEHFQYAVSLSGTYSGGGTEGCFPPFDQPACPRSGSLSAVMSFDTPIDGDGSWLIEPGLTDIADFSISLGAFSTDLLVGGISVTGGAPQGTVQALDDSESFSFDWATRTARFTYDYGYHAPNGSFAGSLSAVPEPAVALLMLAGLGLGAATRGERRRRTV